LVDFSVANLILNLFPSSNPIFYSEPIHKPLVERKDLKSWTSHLLSVFYCHILIAQFQTDRQHICHCQDFENELRPDLEPIFRNQAPCLYFAFQQKADVFCWL